MAKYKYDYKNIVERTWQYRKIMNLVKSCLKAGGAVDFVQTGTKRVMVNKKTIFGRRKIEVSRGVYDIKLELQNDPN
jgi:hypothetical protein